MSLKKTKSNINSKKLKVPKKPTPSSSTTATKAPTAVRRTDSDESDSSGILSDDENQWKETKRIVGDPTPEYQNIQKLIRYVKAGNTTATIVSLCCLKDYDLSIPMNQMVSLQFLLYYILYYFILLCVLVL